MLSLKSESSSGDISHSSRKGMKISQNLLNKRGAQCAWSSTHMTTGSSTDLCGMIGKSYGLSTTIDVLPEDVFLKYLTYIERVYVTFPAHGSGTYWCGYVKDGDESYFHVHAVSMSTFPAHAGLLSRGDWVAGQPVFSPSTMPLTVPFLLMKKMAPMLHSSTRIVCA